MKTRIKKVQKRSKPKLVAKLDKVFSEYIRLRDSFSYQGELYFRCISCGQIKPYAQADCGHYINRGHMSTRYHEDNCHAQCRSCNRFDEGNIYNYRRGLVGKIGEQRVVLLESQKNETKKYSDFELEAMIKHYGELVRKLKNLCKR